MNIQELLDHRTGMIEVKKGNITQEELYLVIKKQKKILSETKVLTPVSDILLNKNDTIDNETIDNETIDKELKKPVLELFIPDNKMFALLSIKEENRENLTVEDIHTFLKNKGINYGIAGDDVILKHLDKIDDQDAELRVASGKMPLPGIPDEIKCFFDNDSLSIGTMTEKGVMDWKNRGKIVQVNEETLLAEIKPGVEGTPGINIYGQLALPEDYQTNLICGEGVRQAEDGEKFYSTIKGKPQIFAEGEISVVPVLVIENDLGVKTGHVDFEGHVEVKGVIQKDYKVKAKSLSAKGIQEAEIVVVNDIVVAEGIFGAKIRNNGSIKAEHIHKADIIVLGDIVVGTEIRDSVIETSGRCIVGGSIFASEISAKKGIKSKKIGSESAGPSKFTVGVDSRAKREEKELRGKILKNQTEIARVEPTITTLKQKSNALNTELGEFAQVQDKYIVKHRQLLESSKTDTGKTDELEEKILQSDKTVEELLKKDEQIIKQIKETKFIINNYKDQIYEFKNKIDEINEKSESDKSIAIVKASSAIYPITTINGRNSSIKIKEIIQRATISEKKITNPDTGQLWHMKISHR